MMTSVNPEGLAQATDFLRALDARLRDEIRRFHVAGKDPHDPFRGLYVSDHEAAGLANGDTPLSAGPIAETARRAATLAERFDLSRLEIGALLLATAVDLDIRYERVFAYLQDNVSRKRPALDLAIRLLCDSVAEERSLRHALSPIGRLGRDQLVQVRASDDASLLASSLHVDERVASYLIGSDEIDPRLSEIVDRRDPGRREAELPGAILAIAEAIAERWSAARECAAVVVTGGRGAGKRAFAHRIATLLGREELAADVEPILRSETPATAALGLIFREAVLQDAPLYLRNAALLFDEADTARRLLPIASERIARSASLVILGGPTRWDAPSVIAGRPAIRVDIGVPGTTERARLWRIALSRDADRLEGDLARLAASFRLSAGQIVDAANVARARASLTGVGPRDVDVDDLFAASRAVSSRSLTAVGEEVRSSATWDDIVLPPDVIAQLRELCANARERGRVLEEWGFAARSGRGTGTTALFAGPSGTGKTFCASIVARELGLPLFTIDVARVVSKWIGETEKNLESVFRAAEDSNAVLFLDEADALFGKRTEVKDSHDRYANLEISFLLQRMELYDGMAILATNMPQFIDDAFTRRLSFTIFFPIPDEPQRLRIWQTAWPSSAPRAEDVDLSRFARFKLTGGNIRNVLLAAAYLAAADASPISAEHLKQALRREYQKIGKEIALADFD